MKKRLTSTIILIAYSAILVKIMVLKDVPPIRVGPVTLSFGGTHEGPANFVPFKTILPYLLGEQGFFIAALNIVGNIVFLIPIGFLVPFIYSKMTWKKSLLLAIAAGCAIEGMQVVLHVGIFDIDDVILNGLGVMIGYWAFTILAKMSRPMKFKAIIITAAIVVAGAAASYGLVVYQTSRQPLRFERVAGEVEPDSSVSLTPQGVDPCNGTGGTGQIVSLGNKTITIKRNDGVDEILNLTDKTTIRNSVGPISEADLKLGDRVTVVVMEKHVATTVLVCGGKSVERGK